MPETRVIFYQDEKGKVPVLEWLDELEQQDQKGLLNCLDRIQQLASMGHELRRPLADFLRDGIAVAISVRTQTRLFQKVGFVPSLVLLS